MPGDPVTVIDGLDSFCHELRALRPTDPWKASKESLSRNSMVVPMNGKVMQFGLCLSRLIGLHFHEGYIQRSLPNYEIGKHNHVNDRHPVYALFYIESEGEAGTLKLYDPDHEVERTPGRLIVIPENRLHSVSPVNGSNMFLRLVFMRSPGPHGNGVDRSILKRMRKLAQFRVF